MKFQRKLVKIGGSLRLTLPMEIAQGQGWKEGDALTFTVSNGEVFISKE